MSLVGTRPILQDELLKYELHHRARIAIKWSPLISEMIDLNNRLIKMKLLCRTTLNAPFCLWKSLRSITVMSRAAAISNGSLV